MNIDLKGVDIPKYAYSSHISGLIALTVVQQTPKKAHEIDTRLQELLAGWRREDAT